MTNKTYRQTQTCSKCNHTTVKQLTAVEAAFETNNKFICEKCGWTDYNSSSLEKPNMTKELFDLWCKNEEFMYSSQDEEIMIAEYEDLRLLEKFMLEESTLPYKKGTLLESLCVLLFNYSFPEDVKKKDRECYLQKRDEIKEVLMRNLSQFVKLKEYCYIEPYIKEVVFPELGVE